MYRAIIVLDCDFYTDDYSLWRTYNTEEEAIADCDQLWDYYMANGNGHTTIEVPVEIRDGNGAYIRKYM